MISASIDGFAKARAFIRRCNSRGDFLLLAFAVLFAPLLFSNVYTLAPKLFPVVFLPAAFVLWFSLDWSIKWPIVKVCFAFRPIFVFSIIIAAVFVYLLSMNLSSWSQPGFDRRMVDQQWAFAGFILLFMIITAQAVGLVENFLLRLIAVLVPLVAISALINVWSFLSGYQTLGWQVFLYRLVNWLGMPGYTNSTNISLTYAIYFIAALSVASDKRSGRLLKFWLAPCALMLLFAMLLTQSRSAYVGALVGTTVVIMTAGSRIALRRNTIIWIAAIAIATAAILAIPATREVIEQRGQSLRPAIWKIYVEKAIAKPVLGYGGLSNIDILTPDNILIDQPHNIILSAQIRGGLFCMLAMVTLLCSSAWWAYRYFETRRCAVPLALIATLGVTGMFDYNLLITATTWPWITFWFPFAICAGAEIATRCGLANEHARPGA